MDSKYLVKHGIQGSEPDQPAAMAALPEFNATSLQPLDGVLVDETADTELADWESAYLARLQSHRMKAISEALMRPLDTRARELKARALEAYENGWFDDAYRDLLESAELNRYDFTIHQALGNIAMAHRDDSDEAEGHYAAAAKYAGPKSPADAAYALLSLASVAEMKGDMQTALRRADEALRLGQGVPEAHFALARYLSATNGPAEEIVSHLDSAFRGKAQLCARAGGDPLLSLREDVVTKTIHDYRELLRNAIDDRLRMLLEAQQLLEQIATDTADPRIGRVRGEIDSIVRRLEDAEHTDSILALADTLVTLRREAVPLTVEAATAVKRVSETLEVEETRARQASEIRSGEVRRSRFLYIIGGALVFGGSTLVVQMLVPTAGQVIVCSYPFLVALGALAGGMLNGHQARLEQDRADGLENAQERLDRVASGLNDVRERLRAHLISAGDPVECRVRDTAEGELA